MRTLEDLIHAVTNSLSLISSQSQYLLWKRCADAKGTKELQVIYEEAERAAGLLSLVPRGVARVPIQNAQRLGPRTVGRSRGAGGAGHGKGRR
jgi:hypothetical protein